MFLAFLNKPAFSLRQSKMVELEKIIALSSVVMNTMMSISGLVINGSMIIIVSKYKDLHRKPNILMSCLSTADLLVNVAAQPVTGLLQVNKFMGTTVFHIDKAMSSYVIIATFVLSLLILTIVCVDRAVACTFPLFHKVRFTKERLLIAVATCLPWPWTTFAVGSSRYFTFAITFVILVCVALIFISCIAIIIAIKKPNNLVNGNEAMIQLRLKQLKSAKTALLIVAVQCAVYVPWCVIGLNRSQLQVYWPWATALVFSNSFLNSTLFICRSNDLNKRYKKVFCQGRPRNVVEPFEH